MQLNILNTTKSNCFFHLSTLILCFFSMFLYKISVLVKTCLSQKSLHFVTSASSVITQEFEDKFTTSFLSPKACSLFPAVLVSSRKKTSPTCKLCYFKNSKIFQVCIYVVKLLTYRSLLQGY